MLVDVTDYNLESNVSVENSLNYISYNPILEIYSYKSSGIVSRVMWYRSFSVTYNSITKYTKYRTKYE